MPAGDRRAGDLLRGGALFRHFMHDHPSVRAEYPIVARRTRWRRADESVAIDEDDDAVARAQSELVGRVDFDKV